MFSMAYRYVTNVVYEVCKDIKCIDGVQLFTCIGLDI